MKRRPMAPLLLLVDPPQRHLEAVHRLEDLFGIGVELLPQVGVHTLEPPRVADVRLRSLRGELEQVGSDPSRGLTP
jgi:hypothetical protein